MAIRPWKRVALQSLLLSSNLFSQQPEPSSAEPSFEVVSIRVVPPNAPPTERTQEFTPILPGGQYIDSRTNLLFMIAFAYDTKNPSKQLVGLPDWAKNVSYSIAAKPAQDFPALPPGQNRDQVRRMLRRMLTDHFQLRLHTETRQERVYSLKIGKGGVKIPEVDPPVPPATEGHVNMALGDDGGRMIARKATMTGLAKALTVFLRQPVIDETALKGYYDIDEGWKSPELLSGQQPPSSRLGSDGIALLLSMVQDRFGLQITTSKGPVEYWVVDNIQPPIEN